MLLPERAHTLRWYRGGARKRVPNSVELCACQPSILIEIGAHSRGAEVWLAACDDIKAISKTRQRIAFQCMSGSFCGLGRLFLQQRSFDSRSREEALSAFTIFVDHEIEVLRKLF